VIFYDDVDVVSIDFSSVVGGFSYLVDCIVSHLSVFTVDIVAVVIFCAVLCVVDRV
jgi:hypothetical protein